MALTFIGTAHHDINGKTNLEKILDGLQPNLVFLEGAPETLPFCETLIEQLNYRLDNLAQQGFDPTLIDKCRLLCVGYEARVCQEYVHKSGSALVSLADKKEKQVSKEPMNSPFYRRYFKDLLEKEVSDITLINLKILAQLIDTGINEAEFYYSEIRKYNSFKCVDPRIIQSLCEIGLLGNRDTVFEEEIRSKYSSSKKAVVVIGIFHLLNDIDGRTLYEKIKDLSPKRMTNEPHPIVVIN